jgi:hypothetical protein
MRDGKLMREDSRNIYYEKRMMSTLRRGIEPSDFAASLRSLYMQTISMASLTGIYRITQWSMFH